jgi:hypothetical protein
MTAAQWQPLRDELARWSDAGLRPALWLRDDDAVAPTPALDRLAALARTYRVPMTLAVIPARATQALADYLGDTPLLSGAVHGWSHTNHAPAGIKTSEFPDTRSADDLEADLIRGRDRITALFDAAAARVFVPPWNRIGASGIAALATLGYRALSTFGPEPSPRAAPGIALVNTHVDIIDWKGTRGGRDPVWLARETAIQLAAARTAGCRHVGILTHHLVHDETAWSFVSALFDETAHDQRVTWCRLGDLAAS